MTLPPHGPPEITEAQQAATSLGEVADPTPDNVSRALQDYSPYAVASAAASIGASGGGGGGSQPLSVIGPYTVNWDTPGVNNNRIDLTSIAAGTTVIRAWAIVTEVWVTDEEDGFQFSVEIGDAADVTSRVLTDYPSTSGTVQIFEAADDMLPGNCLTRVGRVPASGWKLRADVWINGGGNLLSGAIDFYALVNIPAL